MRRALVCCHQLKNVDLVDTGKFFSCFLSQTPCNGSFLLKTLSAPHWELQQSIVPQFFAATALKPPVSLIFPFPVSFFALSFLILCPFLDAQVVRIPTHRPKIRNDRSNIVYLSEDAKIQAIIWELRNCHGVRWEATWQLPQCVLLTLADNANLQNMHMDQQKYSNV